MIGLVLAAGAGRRLRPYTDTLPKALVPVDGDITILDGTLKNFAEIGLTEVAIVVGYRKEAVYDRKEALEAKYGLKLTLVDNDKAEEWNNAYSLWCAREVLKRGHNLFCRCRGQTGSRRIVQHCLQSFQFKFYPPHMSLPIRRHWILRPLGHFARSLRLILLLLQ